MECIMRLNIYSCDRTVGGLDDIAWLYMIRSRCRVASLYDKVICHN